MLATAAGLIVTFTVSAAWQFPDGLVTRTQYFPVAAAAMVLVVAPVDHRYVKPVLPASKVTVPPHCVRSAPKLTVGIAFMVTCTWPVAEQLVAGLVTVTEYVPEVDTASVLVVAPVDHK